ncbi:MAG: sigma-70 family RNA polymerase sigma factor [Anaerolineae bacterium]|nr:sigma-70 family RNA polymerase sigma factor [Anaerolineae bacterium]
MNDQELARLRRARAFDRAALAAIYDDYHQPIYRYIYRQVSEVETARDLTAEVFHRLLHAIQHGNGPEQNLRAWLYRAAHNSVIDHYRRQKHRRHLPLKEELVDVNDDPAKIAEGYLSAQAVRAALQQLTLDQRQVLILKFLEGLSNQETAEVLGKPVGAVKSLQHRALAALQRRLVPAEESLL